MQRKIKFGTDGWRAVIGKEFNLTNVAAVAQALSDYLSTPAKVVVGYDTRRLSKESAEVISCVLSANGIKVILSDKPLPTQAVSFAVRHCRCRMGVMVTASHNPADFNGVKLKGEFGGPVDESVTNKIEKLISEKTPERLSLKTALKKEIIKKTDLVKDYLQFIRAYIDMPLLNKAKLSVLADPMHGTANGYIEKLLKAADISVTTIHNDFDSSFGGNKPEPIKKCLKETIVLARRSNFDIVLVSDGDADRVAALDEKGRYISPQEIIALLALHLINYRGFKGAIVKTVAGTMLLDAIARAYGRKLYQTPIGFKHISALMRKKDVLIGGEEAGGIGFKNYLLERDGILSGLLLLEVMAARGRSISVLIRELKREFGQYYYLREDYKCPLNKKDAVKKSLLKLSRKKTFLRQKIKEVSLLDGIRFSLADNSWILFRLSGTEPVLRVYAEASTVNKTKQMLREARKHLEV